MFKNPVAETLLHIDGAEVRLANFSAENEVDLPLLLINGIGRGIHDWRYMPELINSPVVAVDVRKSKKVGLMPSLSDFSDALIHTLDRLDELPQDRINGLGYSWGGLMIQRAALDYPNRFNKLVMAATLAGKQCGVPHPLAVMAIAGPNRSPGYLEAIAPYVYGGDIRRDPELVSRLGMTSLNPDIVSYAKQLLAANTAAYGLYNGLPRIDRRTLVMSGEDDPIAPIENGYVMNDRIKGSELHVVKGGGHSFLLTRPEESARTINRFISET